MFNTKCGCLYCRKLSIPTTKAGWKSRTNKVGHKYGTNGKPNKRLKKQTKAH